MSSSTRLIRPVTADEMLASGVARGWESQPQEASFWFTEDMIEGSLPAELQGTFFRNGPGLTEVYGTKLKHPIDGDGVVCALTLHGGRAHFKSRFVRTASHVAEEEAGQMLFQGQMGSRVPPPAAAANKQDGGGSSGGGGPPKPPRWRDPSHTNVFYHGGKVVSLHEYALPHTLDPVTLDTVGRDSLGDSLDIRAASAHYREDMDLGRLVLVAFRPGAPILGKAPKLRIYEYGSKWQLLERVAPEIPEVNYARTSLQWSCGRRQVVKSSSRQLVK